MKSDQVTRIVDDIGKGSPVTGLEKFRVGGGAWQPGDLQDR